MRIAITLLALALSTLASAASSVAEYQLKNGLKILVKEDHRAPVAVIQLWYKVGSSYEVTGITGISHVLEHMLSKGTPRYPKNVFSKLIAANGGLKNATTAADFTFYYTEITPDKIPLIFELEADRMQHLIIQPEVLKRELHVIMEERRMRTDDNPLGTLRERLRATAFIASPYHHPVVGWPHDIENLTTDDLRHWYQQWYSPNNATLIVAGDVKTPEVIAAAQQYFGAVPARQTPALKPQMDLPALGMKSIVVHYPANSAALIAGYPTPALKTAANSWEPYALMLLSHILNSPQGLLHHQLIKKQHLASSIELEYVPYSRLNNLLTFTITGAAAKDLPQLQQAFLTTIAHVQATLIADKLLTQAKKQLINNRIYQRDSLAQQARELGRLETVGLSWRVAEDFEKNIYAITPQQIQEVAKRYLVKHNLTLAILKPTAAG